jgi:hypothetical protein
MKPIRDYDRIHAAVSEANKLLATLVAYEGQYTQKSNMEVQKRIYATADFITHEVKILAEQFV